MLYPQEVEVWYILPAIRNELCRELLKLGATQKQIAIKMKISESAVSQYLKAKRAAKVKFSGAFLKELVEMSKRLKDDQIDSFTAVQTLCKWIRTSGELCAIHRSVDSVDAACEKEHANLCR